MSSPDPAPPPQTVVQNTTEPFAEQKSKLIRVFNEAENLFDTHNPTFFPNSTVANVPQATLDARQSFLDLASGGIQPILTSTTGAHNAALQSPATIASDPNVAAAAQAATQPLYDQLLQSVLPGIRNQAVSTGNVGSSRQGIAEGLATQATARAAGEASADIYNQAFANALQSRDRALALSPQIAQLQELPGILQDRVGQQVFSYDQALIDDQIARHAFDQNLPSAKLGEFSSLVSGGFGSTSFGTSTSNAPRSAGGGVQGALGGALAGAGIGSSFGPIGAGVGAGAGLLLSLFS